MNSPTSSDSPGAGESTRSESREAVQRVKEAGREAVSQAKQQAEAKFEKGAQSAAAAADQTTEALDRMGANLEAEGHDTLAQAAYATSARISTLARYVETRTLDELTREAGQMARNNPALMIAGGVVLGLALSRFFKGSSAAQHWEDERNWRERDLEDYQSEGGEDLGRPARYASDAPGFGSSAGSGLGQSAGRSRDAASREQEGGIDSLGRSSEDRGRGAEELGTASTQNPQSTWRQP
jgi:hypothetical protein